MTPDFSVVNWDYYEWGTRFDSQPTIYSKVIESKDKKLIKVYNNFIELVKKNYGHLSYEPLNCELEYVFGRLRLVLVINSSKLAKDFEPLVNKIKLNNLIRKALNFKELESISHFSYHGYTTTATFSNFFLDIVQSLLDIDLQNEYEKYTYQYLDAIRLLQKFILNIKINAKNPSYFNLDHTFCTLIDPIFGGFTPHPDGLLPKKIDFLSRCIFSGFLCNNEHNTWPKLGADSIYTKTGMSDYFILPYLPHLISIRNQVHKQKILEQIAFLELNPSNLNEISDYLKDDPEQLNTFYGNLTMEELIEFVHACSQIKSQQDEQEEKERTTNREATYAST